MDDAKQLMQLCINPIIKTRWLIPATVDQEQEKGMWEVDEFHGRLAGQVLAELELEHEDQTFVKPSFIGEEVTGNPRYYNANM